jgi:hypothetical protein
MHDGQESARLQSTYAPYVGALMASLGQYARSPAEREKFERELNDYVQGRGRPGLTLLQNLSFRLRSHQRPTDAPRVFGMRKWSSV